MAVFATLADVKRQADVSSSAHDDELLLMLEAATERVAALVGTTFAAESVTERITAHGGTALLSRRPVVGPVVVNDGDVTGFRVDAAAGLLHDLPWWSSTPLTAEYTAGTGVVPASVALATAIVAAHLWDTQRGASPSPLSVADQGFGDNLPAPSGQGYALPHRARELLEPFIHEPQAS